MTQPLTRLTRDPEAKQAYQSVVGRLWGYGADLENEGLPTYLAVWRGNFLKTYKLHQQMLWCGIKIFVIYRKMSV